jgi:hypothetical protein
MKKINRRDYLKYMGIAAAGTVGAAELNLLRPGSRALASNRDNRMETIETLRVPEIATAPQATPPHWPWTNIKPGDANPGIRLIFMGMAIFTYKRDEGRVVFHRGADHNLRIVVLESCNEIFSLGGGVKPVTIDEMEISVDGKSSDVSFFKNGAFVRERDVGDSKDFRWILDLESPPFHNGKLPRIEEAGKFSTKLKVGNGTFYTYQHTNSRFKCKGGASNGMKVGHVAKVMAADIPLMPNECASFTINKQALLPPLCRTGDIKYEIYFLNGCQHCTVSDFDMVFDAVETGTIPPFGLELDGPKGRNDFPQGLCITPLKVAKRPSSKGHEPNNMKPRSITVQEHIFLNDDAPCMGSGFGAGGGWP